MSGLFGSEMFPPPSDPNTTSDGRSDSIAAAYIAFVTAFCSTTSRYCLVIFISLRTETTEEIPRFMSGSVSSKMCSTCGRPQGSSRSTVVQFQMSAPA